MQEPTIQEINPKKFKFKPWMGIEEEIYKGRKTIVSFYEDRLEYSVDFTQKVYIAFIKEGEESDPIEKDNFCLETGSIDKSNIGAFVKYVETEYTPKTGEEIKVHKVDISYGSSVLTLATSTEKEKDDLYNEIYNWKYIK